MEQLEVCMWEQSSHTTAAIRNSAAKEGNKKQNPDS